MANEPSTADNGPMPNIDSTVPHSARIWNYWLGGKDNYEVDRIAGDQFRAAFPGIPANARAFRYFLSRAITYLAAEAGVRQFLDIGTGLPTADNTHETAQRVAPESRIVYVDNDPLVLTHARALLTSAPEGATDYLNADLHDRDAIFAAAAKTLDFSRPVALILSGILGHVADLDEARAIVRGLMDQLPSGSYLLVCDGSDTNEVLNEAQRMHNANGQVQYHLRSPQQIASYFEELELVEPGVVSCPLWRPATTPFGEPAEVDAYGGVGRKS
ncbi:SAM-dependent methyltransferase [Streptomyces sp. 549]|uniref:SAM-dependent methyltransferase n=1 Tax=Streptomyces sp. 549 TaxID=3049076 RepID=UPI0024C46C5F|nr:SAM-dependent methyltransferase [Streptomyces sp. 549]MDK1476317.1 SAM-dependent methyltransferase [Streptomyces sp. 549]